MHWPDGFACPRYGERKYSYASARWVFQCSSCRTQTTAKAGTIFHKSRTPLVKWFLAIYLLTQSRNDIATLELARQLGVKHVPAKAGMGHRLADQAEAHGGHAPAQPDLTCRSAAVSQSAPSMLSAIAIIRIDLLPRNWTVRIEKILVLSLAGNARTIDEDEQIQRAADRSRESGHGGSWKMSSDPAHHRRDRVCRTSDRPGSVQPPRIVAARIGCHSNSQ
jgi:hypothetical protein